MLGKYVLDDQGNPKEEPDLSKWVEWLRIMTGKPVLWETMIFGGPFDGEQHRYTSKMEALKEHKELVVKLRRSNVEKPEKPKRLLRPIGE